MKKLIGWFEDRIEDLKTWMIRAGLAVDVTEVEYVER